MYLSLFAYEVFELALSFFSLLFDTSNALEYGHGGRRGKTIRDYMGRLLQLKSSKLAGGPSNVSRLKITPGQRLAASGPLAFLSTTRQLEA